VLHGFTEGADGSEPEAALIMDKSGNLYGTAPGGGDLSCGSGIGCGVVFKLTPQLEIRFEPVNVLTISDASIKLRPITGKPARM